MDLLAGRVAYEHSDGLSADRPLIIVTAACDRITISPKSKILDLSTDMRLIGMNQRERQRGTLVAAR
jgi:hypothetical protein